MVNTSERAIKSKELNEQQALAVEFIINKVKSPSPDDRVFGLYGTAGTGKTYTAKYILDALGEEGILGKSMVVAPTNSACKTLSKAFKGHSVRTEVSTIARALGQRPEIGEDGDQQFVSRSRFGEDGEPLLDNIETIDLLIGDEFSMVNQQNLDQLLGKIKPTCKVLIMMDKWQLPPVGSDDIPVESIVGDNFYELTKTERYSPDSYIYKVISASRDAVIKTDRYFNLLYKFPQSVKETERGAGYIVHDSVREALYAFGREANKMIRAQTWEHVRCVCWRNKTVDEVNKFFRSEFLPYGLDITAIPGELFITTGAVKRRIRGYDTVLYPTATDLIIEKSWKVSRVDDDGQHWVIWETLVYDPDDDLFSRPQRRSVNIIDQYAREAFYDKLERLKKAIAQASRDSGYKSREWWRAFNQMRSFEDLVDPVRPAYAVTGYGAQGKSYSSVYLHYSQDISRQFADIDKQLRTAFVGCSRAKYQLNGF
jgi:hypothetical protein